MTTIWKDKYLKSHTKRQLEALEKSYETQRWQCPRCDEINPVWSRIRIIVGNYERDGIRYEINYHCYNADCNFKRSTGKEYNIYGTRPRNKDRKKPQEFSHLEYQDKWWEIELLTYGRVVITRWNDSKNEAAFQQHLFQTVKEAEDFYLKKVDEMMRKGYSNPSVKSIKRAAAKRKR